MTTILLAALADDVAAFLHTALHTDVYQVNVWSRDGLPESQVLPLPYIIVDQYPAGSGGWEDGLLETPGSSGAAGVQLMGVGRQRLDAMDVLDKARAAMVALTNTDLTDCDLRDVASTGPPSAPIRAGTLVSTVETYVLHVEAR